MKVCTFERNGQKRLGAVVEQGIIDVMEALETTPAKDVPKTMDELYQNNKTAIKKLENYITSLSITENASFLAEEESLDFKAPITNPGKIICVGLNYKQHADETGAPYPETPILFSKFNNTLTGHKHVVEIPVETEQVDYEVELAIIVGEKMKAVSKEEAINGVFGYCTANDLSARDLQFKTPQWLLGKTCDGFSPMGPYVVTADEVEDPQKLHVKTIVNGKIRQNSSTSDMIFSCDTILSYISRHMTLEPGDIILTGTPEGVILGDPEPERVYLKAGDTVTVEIEQLGSLTNTFIEEKV
ncbi:fumarylacetoacetate hydrolase family protein [Alteribacillus sp. HJP-4]|uniref:fumarylacetoacetate hydrolase family protein n=1 Tax=Alteribacillus sp. HJP-4 TaxID=2775394 RepID=UPI0035CD147F